MVRSTTERLAEYHARYAQLAGELADIGLIAAGSVAHRHTRCASVLRLPRLTTVRSTTSDTRSGRPRSRWLAMAASNQAPALLGASNTAVSETSS